MREYKNIAVLIVFVTLFAIDAFAADIINFGNSFFNKDRVNSVSKVVTVINNTNGPKDFYIEFPEHQSMQTIDMKVVPLTTDLSGEGKSGEIAEDSCIQHYGEQLFNLAAGKSCRLHLTFVPSRVGNYAEKMVIKSNNDMREYSLTGTGIMMPDFTVLYFTDDSGENIDNKKAEYNIKWVGENSGVLSNKYAYIKIKQNADSDKPLTFSIEGSNAFFVDKKLSTCNISGSTIYIKKSDECGLVLGFKPNASGDFTAKLRFNQRILSGALEYKLTGIASDVLDFGKVYYGGNVQTVLIANTTGMDQVYSILSESKESNFRIVSVHSKNIPSCLKDSSLSSFALPEGKSCYLGFTFSPDKNKEFSKTFIVMSNSGDRKEITLKGLGEERLKE